jgi:hypothetical protein
MAEKRGQFLSCKKLDAYREKTFHIKPGTRVQSYEEAIEFVNERGYAFFWPVKDCLLPSLWTAHTGRMTVPKNHDDPGHRTWAWKDDSLDKKVWYYAHILRHRATMVSLDTIPYFYALSPNYGDPEQDYLIQYEEGNLTQESKLIYEALLKEGALDRLSLRKAARLASANAEQLFNKALDDLQVELKVLPIGVAEVGAWKYSFIYELTHRQFPWIIKKAQPISESQARKTLIGLYFDALGVAQTRDLVRLFHWAQPEIEKTLEQMIRLEDLIPDWQVESQPGNWFVTSALVS